MNDETLEQLLAHASFVRGIARELARDPNEADDVAQEVLAAAIEHPPRHFASLRRWLGALTRNAARKRWRGESRRAGRERAAARPEALPSSASIVAREEVLRRVVEAVLALDEPYRTTVLMRFYENLPPRRIAERTGVAVDTVHTRLRRALARMRRSLSGSDPDWRSALVVFVRDGAAASASAVAAKVAVVLAVAAPMAWVASSLTDLEPGSSAAALSDGTRVSLEGITAREDDVLSRAPEPAADSRSALPDGRAAVWGRVVDLEGRPVRGATVAVGAEEDPFDERCDAPALSWNTRSGRLFTTDDEGRFSAELPRAGRVVVRLRTEPHYAIPGREFEEREAIAPAGPLEFVVERVGVATLVVRAELAGSRKPLETFRVAVHGGTDAPGRYTNGYASYTVQNGLARHELSVKGAERRVHVVLLEPRHVPPPEIEVVLRPGSECEAVLVVPVEQVVSGYVVDVTGRPIEGALVYFGDESVGRGDEPFRTFHADRVAGAERTAGDGWFELAGAGDLVGAWHERFTGATVPARDAARIVLGPRARILGTLRDEQGAPVAGARIGLDDLPIQHGKLTDERGAFEFRRLEAGAHLLLLEGTFRNMLAVVRLAPGEAREVELVRRQGVLELEFTRGGAPVEILEMHGFLIGLDEVTALHEISHWRPRTDDPVELDVGLRSGDVTYQRIPSPPLVTVPAAVPSGRYLLVASEGYVARIDARGSRETVELGTCRVLVRGRPGAPFQLVPEGSDPLARLVAARCPVRIPDRGEIEISVREGAYEAVGDRGRVLGRLEVGGALTSFQLP